MRATSTRGIFESKQHLYRYNAIRVRGTKGDIIIPWQSSYLPGLAPFWVFQKIEEHAGKTGPFMSYYDTTTKCNDHCPMCFLFEDRSLVGLSKETPAQALSFVKKMLPSTPYFRAIVMGGPGEPLLYSRISQTISFFKKEGFATVMYSNANSKSINLIPQISEDVYLFRGSIDAANPKTYKTVHGASGYRKRINNMSKLADHRARNGTDVILGVHFVIQPANSGEISLFAELAKNLGMDYVDFVFQSYYKIERLSKREQIGAIEQLARAHELVDDSFNVVSPITRRRHTLADKRTSEAEEELIARCFHMRHRLNITVQGMVIPCSVDRLNKDSIFNLGTVSDRKILSKLKRLWYNGPGVFDVRDSTLSCPCFVESYNISVLRLLNFLRTDQIVSMSRILDENIEIG